MVPATSDGRFDDRFVGFEFKQRLVLGNGVAFLDQQLDHITLGDAVSREMVF